MLEPLFGSAAPMWTTLPPAGFGMQAPIGLGNGQIGPSLFGVSNVAALTGGVPAPQQSLSGPAVVPNSPYGYNSGLIAISPQSLGVAPLARNPFVAATEPFVGLTAPSLLAAVAMRRGQPQGPTTEAEVEDFIYDALELLAGASDVEVRFEGGRVTLTGSVPHKRVKRDAGEIAWAVPVINDVQNNLTIASRRRSRGGAREGEGAVTVPGRKQN